MSDTVTPIVKVLKRAATGAVVGDVLKVRSGNLYRVTDVMRYGWNNRVEGYGVVNVDPYTFAKGTPYESIVAAGTSPNYFAHEDVEAIVRI